MCGPGGIGKTRLALKLACELAASYPDGVWLADQAEVDRPSQVLPMITTTLGIRAEHDRPLADTLAEALRPRKMLLILDTCDHLVQESAELVQWLLGCCPGLRVVATSREALRVRGEVLWRVPPLGLPAAADGAASRGDCSGRLRRGPAVRGAGDGRPAGLRAERRRTAASSPTSAVSWTACR